MEIINTTDYLVAPLTGRVNFPQHSLTLIVKGTFDLKHGESAVIADEQLYPTGDEYYPGDQETPTIKYDSDFSHFKPAADLLLVGKCYTPGSTPLQSCRVTFQVGSKQSSLAIFGDRFWRPVVKLSSAPELFTVMDLRYENSFGGTGYHKNPQGLGHAEILTMGNETIRPLPNIENIHHLIDSPDSRPDPAGFGPIDRMWPQRTDMLGTYSEHWLKERWPWFPADFNWYYYNSAPAVMQVNGYLRGDENLRFENLHPSISDYRSQLPGQRVRCFITRGDPLKLGLQSLTEVEMNLDTLWTDMDDEKLVLVWRGITDIETEEYEEITHLFIVSEKLDEASCSIQEIWHNFEKILTVEEPSFMEEVTEDTSNGQSVSIEEELRTVEETLTRELLGAGIDIDKMLVERSPEDVEAEKRLLAEHGLDQEDIPQELNRNQVKDKVAAGVTLAGEDFSNLDLSGLDLRGGDFREALFLNANVQKVHLDGASLEGAQFEHADLSGASIKNVTGADADFTSANLRGADLSDSILRDACFEDAQMANTRCDNIQAVNAYFSGADLSGASLKNALCDEADFSNSLLDKSDFTGASLREASVEGARGEGIGMEGCDLTELRASEKCSFINGVFRAVSAVESIWEDADLSGADFSGAHLAGADFSSAMLHRVNFRGADMKQARFIKADLSSAVCSDVNLFESSFEKARLDTTDFTGSNLYGAEFFETNLENVDFSLANLKMTKLAGKLV